ncbi:transporter substrate-binding domain-containing protein [Ottowia thiooxydans]|uniref:transporter substrate-binding domain-containing protein n=1 Tax=Ottowia thiooxydans TaxID=219182 RepID=UPI00048C2E7D|nr:transporter substrate-binding domain-containing protein [Ottowia thiooxydans]
MIRFFASASLAALTVLASTSAMAGKVMDKINERGQLAACIKLDYRPFGYRAPNGDQVGLEHDLVADLAKRLGQKFNKPISVEKISVIAANRVQFVQQGKCDVLIGTMTDNADRRKVINIVQPNYYSSGITVIARKSTPIKTWDDIRGKKLCVSQGAFWNKEYQRRYDLDLQAFAGIAEAGQALQDGRCIGNLTDDALAASRLLDTAMWGDFEIKLPVQDREPWGVATQYGDDEFAGFLSSTITAWHREGILMALEKKWELQPTAFVKEMQEKYKNAK